jgi:GST-like protein
MIELFTWPTPNGQKVHIALEELGLPYTVTAVNIQEGDQFKPEFLAINPNHRIPAIIDQDGPGGAPLPLFESGAILIYLAEKSGALIPADPAGRYICLQWLMFQMGGVGPMFGQANHFLNAAPERLQYAIDRYTNEVARLIRVLEKRLAAAPYLAGDAYSIADIATFPWIRSAVAGGRVSLEGAPSVQRWHDAIDARPAVARGLAVLADRRRTGPISDRARDILYGATQHAAR